MGSRGPKPEGTPYEELPEVIRADIERAARSAAGESARLIYERFGLSQRGVSWSSFRRVVAEIRNAAADTKADDSTDAVDVSELTWSSLERKAMEQINANLDTGKVKTYEVVAVIKAAFDKDRLDIEQKAEARAQAKFDEYMADLRKRKARADAEAARELRSEGLSDDAIDRIRDIYGLARGGESDLPGEGADGG